MSGSCCGGASKAESARVAKTSAPQMTEAVTEHVAAKPNKSECCNDNPAKSEKHGCGC
jgi:hypothetical protein